MKYIFVAGAPGSKWSSVVQNIYYSPDIDRSDSSPDRQYHKTAHEGAYWDPGMEFDIPESLSLLSHAQAEELFDSPFSGTGICIIKSHIFCYLKNIQYLRSNWPQCPIVLVYRPDDACVGWWVRAGEFGIAYPNYRPYYRDLPTLCDRVQAQNHGLQQAWHEYSGTEPATNQELAQILGLSAPPLNHAQNYAANDIQVKVI